MKPTKPKTPKGAKQSKLVKHDSRDAVVAKFNTNRNRKPVVKQSGDRIIVTHREFVRDIFSDINNDFAYDVFNISPIDPETFPWLSNLAVNYESFRFRKFDAHYEPTVATNISGKIVLAVDYDSADPTDNETKSTLLQWGSSVDGQVWTPIHHHSSVSDLNKIGPTRFLNPLSSVPFQAGPLSNAGILYVATTSVMPAQLLDFSVPSGGYVSYNLGELWIDYEVELITPQLQALDDMTATGVPRITETQFDQTASVSAGQTVTNLLDLYDTTAVFNPAAQTVRNITTASDFGVDIVDTPVYALMSDTNVAQLVPQRAFRFNKDFIGNMDLNIVAPGGFVGPTPTTPIEWKQNKLNTDNDVFPGLIGGSKNTPSLLENVVVAATEYIAGGTLTGSWRLAIRAGTYLIPFLATALGVTGNVNNKFSARINTHKYISNELLGQNLLRTPSVQRVSTSIKPRFRPGDMFHVVAKARAAKLAALAIESTSATSATPPTPRVLDNFTHAVNIAKTR